ncbi:unnamed protein product, partial [Brachionus calyciflorus]
MGEKKTVSYLVIGAYAAFVLGSSLLVGLLPPFVNRPTCKDDSAALVKQDIQFESISNQVLERPRREVQEQNEQTKRPDLNERISNFKKTYPGRIEELSTKFSRSVKSDGYGICEEIVNPQPGTNYPWYSQRLPDRYVPLHYDVELFVPQWTLSVYDGFMDMKVDIRGSSQDKYILVH